MFYIKSLIKHKLQVFYLYFMKIIIIEWCNEVKLQKCMLSMPQWSMTKPSQSKRCTWTVLGVWAYGPYRSSYGNWNFEYIFLDFFIFLFFLKIFLFLFLLQNITVTHRKLWKVLAAQIRENSIQYVQPERAFSPLRG